MKFQKSVDLGGIYFAKVELTLKFDLYSIFLQNATVSPSSISNSRQIIYDCGMASFSGTETAIPAFFIISDN